MNKKNLIQMLTVPAVLTLAACNHNDNNGGNQSQTPTQPTPTPVVEEATKAGALEYLRANGSTCNEGVTIDVGAGYSISPAAVCNDPSKNLDKAVFDETAVLSGGSMSLADVIGNYNQAPQAFSPQTSSIGKIFDVRDSADLDALKNSLDTILSDIAYANGTLNMYADGDGTIRTEIDFTNNQYETSVVTPSGSDFQLTDSMIPINRDGIFTGNYAEMTFDGTTLSVNSPISQPSGFLDNPNYTLGKIEFTNTSTGTTLSFDGGKMYKCPDGTSLVLGSKTCV